MYTHIHTVATKLQHSNEIMRIIFSWRIETSLLFTHINPKLHKIHVYTTHTQNNPTISQMIIYHKTFIYSRVSYSNNKNLFLGKFHIRTALVAMDRTKEER